MTCGSSATGGANSFSSIFMITPRLSPKPDSVVFANRDAFLFIGFGAIQHSHDCLHPNLGMGSAHLHLHVSWDISDSNLHHSARGYARFISIHPVPKAMLERTQWCSKWFLWGTHLRILSESWHGKCTAGMRSTNCPQMALAKNFWFWNPHFRMDSWSYLPYVQRVLKPQFHMHYRLSTSSWFMYSMSSPLIVVQYLIHVHGFLSRVGKLMSIHVHKLCGWHLQ